MKKEYKAITRRTDALILPVHGKKCVIDDWQLLAQVPDDAWVDSTGYGVRLDGMTVVDIDDKRSYIPILEELSIAEGGTFTVQTRNGYHLYFKGIIPNSFKTSWGEVKTGVGHYVVGPGSPHPDGGKYRIIHDQQLTSVPESLARMARLVVEVDDTPLWALQEGSRNMQLFKAACKMVEALFSRDAILAALKQQNSELVNPLRNKELSTIVKSAYKRVAANVLVTSRMDKIKARSKGSKDSIQSVDFHKPVNMKLAIDDAKPLVVVSGIAMLGYGQLNWITGQWGYGKTHLILAVMQHHIRGGGTAVYIDGDDSYVTFLRRLKEHRFSPEDAERMAWLSSDTWRNASDELIEDLLDIEDLGHPMLVIDSATNCGCPPDGPGIDKWLDQFVRPFQRMEWTLAVLDHPPKKALHQGSPTGIGQKGHVSGVMYALDAAASSHVNPYNESELTFIVTKDRSAVTGAAIDSVAFVMVSKPKKKRRLSITFRKNTTVATRKRKAVQDKDYTTLLLQALNTQYKLTQQPVDNAALRRVARKTGVGQASFAEAIKQAIDNGLIEVQVGAHNRKTYTPNPNKESK